MLSPTACAGATLIITAAMASVPAAAAAPDWCGPGRAGLSAAAMPEVVRLDECDLRGRVVQGPGGTAVTVPEDGTSVSAHMLHSGRSAELDVTVSEAAGTALVRERDVRAHRGRPRTHTRTRTHDRTRADDACQDGARTLGRSRWPRGGTVTWYYHEGTADRSGLSQAEAAEAVTRGVANATGVRTDCDPDGRYSPAPDIGADRAGRTGHRPAIGPAGNCGRMDGTNAFGWRGLGTLGRTALAVTCLWHRGGVTRESDIAVRTQGQRWWTPPDGSGMGGCPRGHYEPATVVTHEMLHTLGLRHIAGGRHRDLTMSPYILTCDDSAATLGKGDYEGLIQLYGPR